MNQGNLVDSGIAGGYLVLVDISGFTSFVAEAELDHSKVIIGDIFKLILSRFAPRLQIAEIEGDAVFAYASDKQFPRGETLLEIIEATYFDFRDKQQSAQRMATCTCKGCKMIGQLDLKFITHYGEFILQDVAGKAKPLGTSVNLLHRLSKNQVSGATGWHGYALFTEASLHRMDVHPLNVHAQTETYEHLGAVETFSMNLDDRYTEFISDRHAILAEEEAHVVLRREFPIPPSELWEWLNDPEKRLLWMVGSDWHALDRPQGRTSQGASNHCANSDFIEHILDWRPFSYYTVELTKAPIRATVTAVLEPTAIGTTVSWRARLNGFLPQWMLRLLCKLLIKKGARTPESFDVLTRILREEKSVNEVAA